MKLSPFVYKFSVAGDVLCMYHSISLKKIYVTNSGYKEISVAILNNKKTNVIRSLMKQKFVVADDYNANTITNKIFLVYR